MQSKENLKGKNKEKEEKEKDMKQRKMRGLGACAFSFLFAYHTLALDAFAEPRHFPLLLDVLELESVCVCMLKTE